VTVNISDAIIAARMRKVVRSAYSGGRNARCCCHSRKACLECLGVADEMIPAY